MRKVTKHFAECAECLLTKILQFCNSAVPSKSGPSPRPRPAAPRAARPTAAPDGARGRLRPDRGRPETWAVRRRGRSGGISFFSIFRDLRLPPVRIVCFVPNSTRFYHFSRARQPSHHYLVSFQNDHKSLHSGSFHSSFFR